MEEQIVNLLSRILMELFSIDMSSLPKEARNILYYLKNLALSHIRW